MPSCPHCGQEIELPGGRTEPWWKPDLATHGVNLGCGSLALIAIIVAFCSGGVGVSSKLERLDMNVEKLEKKIDELRETVSRPPQRP
jgi:hypothetical protein